MELPEGRRKVNFEEGLERKEEITKKFQMPVEAYLECSAIKGTGVKAVFDCSVTACMKDYRQRKKRCPLF